MENVMNEKWNEIDEIGVIEEKHWQQEVNDLISGKCRFNIKSEESRVVTLKKEEKRTSKKYKESFKWNEGKPKKYFKR
jgi:hypothetical protein